MPSLVVRIAGKVIEAGRALLADNLVLCQLLRVLGSSCSGGKKDLADARGLGEAAPVGVVVKLRSSVHVVLVGVLGLSLRFLGSGVSRLIRWQVFIFWIF